MLRGMSSDARRAPSGAAVLQPQITAAISEAVLDELAAHGYGRLSMEAVAKRAGVGKSALYRRWPSKQDMVVAVLSQTAVPPAAPPDTGSLRGDVRALLESLWQWLVHPRFALILPDVTAEAARNPALAELIRTAIGEPRRALGAEVLRRGLRRGELPADVDLELALDLLPGPLYWRRTVRQVPAEPDYLDRVTEHVLRALAATTT